jgi:hypothetical protein
LSPLDLDKSDPGLLAALMATGAGDETPWRPEELGAILRHQLRSPLDGDLGPLPQSMVRHVTTFADLLLHEAPPPELLGRVKQFAKSHRNRPDSGLPEAVAAVLYYAAIVASVVVHERKISDLDEASLRAGLAWALSQPWLDESTRILLVCGRTVLGDAPGP